MLCRVGFDAGCAEMLFDARQALMLNRLWCEVGGSFILCGVGFGAGWAEMLSDARQALMLSRLWCEVG